MSFLTSFPYFLNFKFSSNAQRVFGLIMSISISQILPFFLQERHLKLSQSSVVTLSVVLGSGSGMRKWAADAAWALMLPNPVFQLTIWCHSGWAVRGRYLLLSTYSQVAKSPLLYFIPTTIIYYFFLFYLLACSESLGRDHQNVYTAAHVPTTAGFWICFCYLISWTPPAISWEKARMSTV